MRCREFYLAAFFSLLLPSATAGAVEALVNSIATVVRTGSYTGAGFAVGTDGLPILAYIDFDDGLIKVAKCANAGCTGSITVTTLDTPYGGGGFSIAMGAGGLPLIAYDAGPDATNGYSNTFLRVAACANAACTASSIATVDGAAGIKINPSMTMGADGLPVIGYQDWNNKFLKVAKCANAACTGTSTITTIDTDKGYGPSIAIGADGLPVISYGGAAAIKVAKCANAACSASTIATIASIPADYSFFTSIVVGADGLPMVAYYNAGLKVAQCANAACTGAATINTVDTVPQSGGWVSIALANDGLPILSYRDSSADDLRVAKCASAACTGGTKVTVATGGGDAYWSSIAIGGDGLPVIAYGGGYAVKVAKCAASSCRQDIGYRYRLYHYSTLEHLYTMSLLEYAYLTNQITPSCCGWGREGRAYQLFTDAVTYGGVQATPYYRLFHPGILQHHWTRDLNEYNFLPVVGWRQEGIDGYILPGPVGAAIPQYRLYYAPRELHLWTTDAGEAAYLTTSAGWKAEGIDGYVLPIQ